MCQVLRLLSVVLTTGKAEQSQEQPIQSEIINESFLSALLSNCDANKRVQGGEGREATLATIFVEGLCVTSVQSSQRAGARYHGRHFDS